MEVLPLDEHNRTLVDQAHPADWNNPTPQGRYNLVAIGSGTAGVISALGTAAGELFLLLLVGLAIHQFATDKHVCRLLVRSRY